MKKRSNKSFFKILSGVTVGFLGGLLFAPTKGQNVRSTIFYRIKRVGGAISGFFSRLFKKKNHIPKNEAKETGEELVSSAQNKAKKLLDDIDKVDKSKKEINK